MQQVYTLLIIAVSMGIGIFLGRNIRLTVRRIRNDRETLRVMRDHYEQSGNLDMVKVIDQFLSGVSPDKIIADMPPEIRKKYELFVKEETRNASSKNGGNQE